MMRRVDSPAPVALIETNPDRTPMSVFAPLAARKVTSSELNSICLNALDQLRTSSANSPSLKPPMLALMLASSALRSLETTT